MTTRDDVWGKVLKKLVEEGEFRVGDLGIEESKRHTVTRVCKEMESLDYLTRENSNSKIWRAGKLADEHLDLSMRAKVAAGFDDDE
jgi:hypothetical protein